MKALRGARWTIGIGLLVAVVAIAGCTLFQPQTTVDMQATPTTGAAPLRVDFTPTVGGNAISYSWDFGDGTTSDQPAPSHIYRAMGTYTVSLTVHLSDGSVAHATKNDLVDVASVKVGAPQYGPLVWAVPTDGMIWSGSRTGGNSSLAMLRSVGNDYTPSLAVANGKLYWTSWKGALQSNLDGSDGFWFYQGQGVVDGIAVDNIGEGDPSARSAYEVYWVEDPVSTSGGGHTPARIWQGLVSYEAQYGVWSVVNQKVWMTESSWTVGGDVPSLLVIDPVNHRLYWTEKPYSSSASSASVAPPKNEGGDSIHWASLTENPPVDHTAFSSLPPIGGIALDLGLPGGAYYLYWTCPSENQIWFGHVGTSYQSMGLYMNTPDPKAIAADASEGKIYWSSDDGIHRANLQDGSDAQVIYPQFPAVSLTLQTP